MVSKTNGDRDDGPSRPRGAPFFYNELLLEPGLSAPLPLIVNSRVGFQAVVRDVLVRFRTESILVEAATVTLGSMLFGCQEVVAGCQDLIASEDERAVSGACGRVLSGCRELSGKLESAYVILQAVESFAADAGAAEDDVASAPPRPGCARLKNLARPLEALFRSDWIEVRMDTPRRALLEVHLDEIFDQSSRQLERFYFAIRHRDSPALFREFGRLFYEDIFKRIVPEHIYDPVSNRPVGGDARSGLLDLLPELQESIGAR